MSWRHYLETLLGLLYPTERSCVSCRGSLPETNRERKGEQSDGIGWMDEHPLCDACKYQLLPIEPPFCQLCGRHLEQPGRCPECERETSFVLSRSYGPYRGVLRDLLHRYKFSREVELLSVLSPCLNEAWDRHMAHFPIDLLVPVPIHPNRLRERGYNQAERLAVSLSSYTNLPWYPVLQRTLHLKGQVTRSRRERLQALLEAYTVNPLYENEIRNKTILLVDDIYTTGSTAEACAYALQSAGADQVYVITVAR